MQGNGGSGEELGLASERSEDWHGVLGPTPVWELPSLSHLAFNLGPFPFPTNFSGTQVVLFLLMPVTREHNYISTKLAFVERGMDFSPLILRPGPLFRAHISAYLWGSVQQRVLDLCAFYARYIHTTRKTAGGCLHQYFNRTLGRGENNVLY